MIDDDFGDNISVSEISVTKQGFCRNSSMIRQAVTVPEDVKQAGNLNGIVHLDLMLVSELFKN